jgi:hypothetical protein
VGDSATVDNPNHQPIDLEAAGIKCQDVQFDHAQKMCKREGNPVG